MISYYHSCGRIRNEVRACSKMTTEKCCEIIAMISARLETVKHCLYCETPRVRTVYESSIA